jgi:hypothetical protein
MVLPRHVICALGAWKSLAPVERVVRSAGGGDFTFDDEHSQLAPDPRMMGAFDAAADRLKPSLLRQDREAILKHGAVVYVLSPRLPAAEAPELSNRTLAVVAALLDAGATAIKGESSGIAHGAARWRALAERARRARGGTRAELLERAAALVGAWVRRPIRDGGLLYSCGMHLLGERDIELPAGAQIGDDLEWMDLLALYQLAEKPARGLVEGEGFRRRPQGERRILQLHACERYAMDDFSYTPYGYWRLIREDDQPAAPPPGPRKPLPIG